MALAACSKKSEETGAEGTDRSEAQAELAAAGADASGDRVDPKDLGALVDLIVAEAAALPREEFDPAALAAKLGKNPQAHFEWVRDHTWWAPYRGLLRGSQGVMLDRVGSSLDRAVLLGDLLRHSGYTVRLAHAQLQEARAREFLSKVRPMPDERDSPAAPRAISPDQRRAIEALVPIQWKSAQDQDGDSRRVTSDAEALIRTQVKLLYAAVNKAGISSASEDGDAIAALSDHWWIEFEEDGRWITMDVLLPDAKIGDAVAAASQTSAWRPDSASPAIPDSEWHEVQIRVVVERYADGRVAELTALDKVLRPAELIEQPISLMHFPKPWPEALPDPASEPDALGNVVVSVKEWVPFLWIGDELVVQSGFTDSGDLIADPFDSGRDIAAVGGGGFMSGFGEALGGQDAAASSMTAEWIDFELRSPGATNRKLRRPVFDLMGPAKRAAGIESFDATTNDLLIERYESLLSVSDILLQPCAYTEEFLTHVRIAGITANANAIKDLARERDTAKASTAASTLLAKIDRWSPLMNLVRLRTALAKKSSDWFIDRPNVMTYRITPTILNADQAQARELIDFASNDVGVRPGAGRSSFEIRLEQGVVDTVAEVLALGADLREAENTASVFSMTGAEPEGSVLVGRRDAKLVQAMDLPDDTAARIVENVDAGFVVLLPDSRSDPGSRGRFGWWRVDPGSGETIGVMDTGFHAATSEDAAIRIRVRSLRNYLERNRDFFRQNTDRVESIMRSGRRLTADEMYWLRVEMRILDALRVASRAGYLM